MNRITFRSLFEELERIEKDAGVKDMVKAVGAAKNKLVDKTKNLAVRASSHPKLRKVVEYASDPLNIADLSHSVANLASRL